MNQGYFHIHAKNMILRYHGLTPPTIAMCHRQIFLTMKKIVHMKIETIKKF